MKNCFLVKLLEKRLNWRLFHEKVFGINFFNRKIKMEQFLTQNYSKNVELRQLPSVHAQLAEATPPVVCLINKDFAE